MTTSSQTKKNITLLCIDVQNDFHPHTNGSLAIPKADEDAQRIATLIASNRTTIDRMVVTLDSHLKLHIAHPQFWISPTTQQSPSPFTIISHEDIQNKVWVPRQERVSLSNNNNCLLDKTVFGNEGYDNVVVGEDDIDLYKYCLEYSHRLETKGSNKFKICIWPEHCLIGTPGHNVVSEINDSIQQWSATTGNSCDYVLKGQNLFTEMYSAIQADVPISKDTSYNHSLSDSLLHNLLAEKQSKLIVCGQAMSHCVNYTLRDLVSRWQQQPDHSHVLSQVILLTDCASAVPGFEAAAEQFMEDMKQAGVQLCKSTDDPTLLF